MVEWVTHFAQTPYGAWALFAISFAESSFFPIPPDVLLLALAAVDPQASLWFATITTVGSVLGGMFGYFIGLKGGRPLMLRLFSHEKIRVVEDYYQRYDVWAVGAAGLTPLPYKLFTITAGVFVLNFPRFVIASAASRGLRFYAEGFFFWFFGPSIQGWIQEYFGWITFGFLVCLVGGFWLVKHLGKRAARSGDAR
ncbi:MAG: DedA family protein [Desulfarculus sp.]|nr:MAG: DedA family protein [Desulfarculus sp.]